MADSNYQKHKMISSLEKSVRRLKEQLLRKEAQNKFMFKKLKEFEEQNELMAEKLVMYMNRYYKASGSKTEKRLESIEGYNCKVKNITQKIKENINELEDYDTYLFTEREINVLELTSDDSGTIIFKGDMRIEHAQDDMMKIHTDDVKILAEDNR